MVPEQGAAISLVDGAQATSPVRAAARAIEVPVTVALKGAVLKLAVLKGLAVPQTKNASSTMPWNSTPIRMASLIAKN